VSDGLEAVQKAEELQPDLIVLDIGLPTLNGIEVARRIHTLSPKSKILFLSQESSAPVVQEALSLGGSGYVVKPDARSELPTAVNAVLRGETFVSRLARHNLTGLSRAFAAESTLRNRVLASRSLQNIESAHRHEAQFYSDDSRFLEGFTQFVGATLKAGNAVIVVATESHREGLLPRLQAYGLDTAAAVEQGRYVSLDAADTLSKFMVNGQPDSVQFLRVVSDLIVSAAKAAKGEPPRVAACGECAPLLWAQGNAEAAIRLERLWNEIGKTYEVSILCGYPLGSLHGEQGTHSILQRICAEHSTVYSR
jgi:CheY-like chemotaxis protein